MNKPPLGVMPRKFWEERRRSELYLRMSELYRAITEYREAGLPTLPEWLDEYDELVQRYNNGRD